MHKGYLLRDCFPKKENIETILKPKLERRTHLPLVERDRKLSSTATFFSSYGNSSFLEKHFKKNE